MHCRSSDASFIKIEGETCELLDGESVFTNYLLHFLKSTKAHEGFENKKNKKRQPVKIFLVEGWSIEGHITKMVERIAASSWLCDSLLVSLD